MDKKAIYKITNNINHKIYIGLSNDPANRFKQHCRNSKSNGNSLIHKAIAKYGKENFSFEILGWFEDYQEKEIYYIQYYRSLVPNGYNIHPGGGDPPHYCGEDNQAAKIDNETARKIQAELLDYSIQRKTIKKKYNIFEDMMRHIIDGSSWHRDDLTYPLRPSEHDLNEQRADEVIKLLQTTQLSQIEIGKRVGWNRSAITMINIGKNHFREGIDYPIRKQRINSKS